MTTTLENKINRLFRELVPASGKADTVAGEIVRAVCRIGYRYYNDGDRIGVEYGKETCNPAARYLIAKAGEDVARIVAEIWGMWDDDAYKIGLASLEQAALDYIERNPELKRTPNAEDMWDYRDEYEDRDDSDDDEEEDW